MWLHSGHLVHNPSGASFFSEEGVVIPFLSRLNQLDFASSVLPSSPARLASKSSIGLDIRTCLVQPQI